MNKKQGVRTVRALDYRDFKERRKKKKKSITVEVFENAKPKIMSAIP